MPTDKPKSYGRGIRPGKRQAVCVAAELAVHSGPARLSHDISIIQFVGAAWLSGIGDTVSLLMAEEAFPPGNFVDCARIGVFAGSITAAPLGAAVIGEPRIARAGQGKSVTYMQRSVRPY